MSYAVVHHACSTLQIQSAKHNFDSQRLFVGAKQNNPGCKGLPPASWGVVLIFNSAEQCLAAQKHLEKARLELLDKRAKLVVQVIDEEGGLTAEKKPDVPSVTAAAAEAVAEARSSWTPQAHYRVLTDEQRTTQGKGYWENAPSEPDPAPEPAGSDATSSKTLNDVPTVTMAAAEAVAAAVKAHAELASNLEVAELLEGADGTDSIVWKLPGLEQTAPAALPDGACTSRTQISTLTLSWLSILHATLGRAATAFVLVGLCTFRCISAAFDQLGTQWRLCTQTDTSDGDHGSFGVFLQIVGDAISEPVAFALRVVAEDDDKVSSVREHCYCEWLRCRRCLHRALPLAGSKCT
eukprot:COSAG02_NODE_3043_length_7483_cov_14.489166_4_plen_351_part_00